MKILLLMMMMLAFSCVHAQEEQAIEDIAEQTEAEIEYDSFLENPINLNTAT